MNPKNYGLLREHFPVANRLVYFNHAAVAPLATPTRQAMEALLADVNENGARIWQDWAAAMERTRHTLARLIGAADQEIALVKNTSEGLSVVAQGLDWKPGDRVVVPESEFPANLYPWLTMRERGVAVELLPESALNDPTRLAERCRGARVLAISFVQYLSGFRLDLDLVGRICRETGTLLVVDAIQGLGAFPVDVKRAGIGVLAADGHKWLTGPEGAGLLFVDEAAVGQIVPRQVGWMSVSDWTNHAAAARAARTAGPLPWRPGAGRYENGTYNTVGVYGLGAAVELLLSAGIANIAAHILRMTAVLAAGLEAQGCRIHRLSSADAHRSGIVSFQRPGFESAALVGKLSQAGVVCACRGEWVRLSPHLYNTEEEVERVLTLVAS